MVGSWGRVVQTMGINHSKDPWIPHLGCRVSLASRRPEAAASRGFWEDPARYGGTKSKHMRIYGVKTVSNQQHMDTVCCSGLWWGWGYHFDHMVIGKPSACDLPNIWTTIGYTTSNFGSVKRSVERVSGCHAKTFQNTYNCHAPNLIQTQ